MLLKRCLRTLSNTELVFLGVLATGVLPVSAFAQDGQAERADSHANTVIEEVIVSATKRESGLQDTGIAISVVSAEDMKFKDFTSLDDMQNSVPGMSVGNVLGTPAINIRGVGLNILTGLGQPGVATHYDGVYLSRTGSTNIATVDIAQVEVLRGPQGTLYGRNATGGSINFIGKHPDAEFGAGLAVGAGDYGRRIYEAYVEGPLVSDKLLARAFLRSDSFDGYGVNTASGKNVNDNDAIMGRVALVYEVTDSLELYASYTRRDDEGAAPANTALTIGHALNGTPYPTELHEFTPYDTAMYVEPMADKSTEISQLTVNWEFAGYTFKSVTGYVEHFRREVGSSVAINEFVADLDHDEVSEAWSQEFNLSSEWFDGRLNWLIGAYYSVDDATAPTRAFTNADSLYYPVPVPSGYVIVTDPGAETKDITEGYFLDGYWSVLDNLRLVYGIRFGQDKNELVQTLVPYVEDRGTGNPAPANITMLFLGQAQLTAETCDHEKHTQRANSTDPKIGIEWDFMENGLLYVQYQTGFKSGGYNVTSGCNQTFKPEEVKALEVGLKMTTLDNTLVFNLAVFDYDYSDYQVFKIDGFTGVIENAATAISRGLEIETRYNATEWLTVDLAYSYLDAYYDDYMAKDNFNNTVWFNSDAPWEDLHGNKLNRAPENTLNIGVSLSKYIGKLGLGFARLRLEGFYSDEYFMREFNRPIEMQESFTKYNTFLSIESANEKVRLDLFVKNITDEVTLAGELGIDTIYYYGGYYEPPRTYGGTLSVRW